MFNDSYLCIENSWYDEIGGHHSDGCGWNPAGTFCGECSYDSCVGCDRVSFEGY